MNDKMISAQERAKNIKMIAFDVDGVLTNGDITYTDKGDEIKTFNAKDGQGIAMLNNEGYITAIITARTSPIVEKRAKDLGIQHVYMGSKNKKMSMADLVNKCSIDPSEIAYVGDDLPDICVLQEVGLACCPNDAVEEVRSICHFVSSKQGGKGAVREITDLIYKSRKQQQPVNSQNAQQPASNSSDISLPVFNKH